MRKLKRQDREKEVLPKHFKSKKTPEKLRKNSGNTGGNTPDKVRKNYGNTPENFLVKSGVFSENYGNTPAQTTDGKRKNYGNTPDKVRKNYGKIKDINLLSGHQKNVFFYLVVRAKDFGSESENGWRITPQISATEIAEQATRTSVKKTRDVVRALVEANILLKKSAKHGPGGWTVYSLHPEAYSKALILENYGNTTDKVRKNYGNTPAQTTDQTTEIVSCSSSDLIQKTTTTDELWKTLKLEPLSHLGISQSVISRSRQRFPNLRFEDVTKLIDRFAIFMAQKNRPRISNPVGFFLDLCKQLSEGVTPLDNIETPEDRYLREYIARQEEKRKKQLELEQKALEFEFEQWFESLNPEQRNQIVKPNGIMESGSHPQKIMLKTHFSEHIWPEKRSMITRGEV